MLRKDVEVTEINDTRTNQVGSLGIVGAAVLGFVSSLTPLDTSHSILQGMASQDAFDNAWNVQRIPRRNNEPYPFESNGTEGPNPHF